MDPDWHIYWQNPGASGMPTTIEWQLPSGVVTQAMQWPLPVKLIDKEVTSYIYTNETVLLVPLKLGPDLKPGPLALNAKVSWLECQVSCIPGSADVTGQIVVGSQAKPSPEAALLQKWQARVPTLGSAVSARAWWEKPATGDLRPLVIEWNGPATAREPDFYPDTTEKFEVQGETERVPASNGKLRIRKEVKKSEGDWPKEISGVLLQQSGSGSERSGCEVNLAVSGPQSSPAAVGRTSGPSLWQMLLYGFIGGLILNIMPCVLPVIALKILSFVGQAKENPARARKLGLIYGAGVLVSFLALAGLVLALKAAGQKAGWGIQFGNPYFLIVMTTLVTLIALNLFGVFEISLGGRAMSAAGSLASKHGATGAFLNGLLATALATSCTAPFLGAAIGFAFAPSQTAINTLLVFSLIAVGLALPYVVLSWQPGWLRFLPKPGPWMERFKIAMGFPMLAAAAWLFSLVALHYGERSWWLAIFLVMVALAAWIYGEFIQRQRANRGIAAAFLLLLLGTAYAWVLENELRWREPVTRSRTALARSGTNLDSWAPWSPSAVAQARAEGRPVLVDFTAKWCLTCNTVVKPALESSSVQKKLKETSTVALVGDYTSFPPEITDELTRHERAGVPLVLVYPKNPTAPPQVLPEAITARMVVRALEQAVR